MITKYAVYDASTGCNVIYDNKNEALQAFWVNVVYTAMNFYHNTPYMIVEIDENGLETWKTISEEIITKPVSEAEIENYVANSITKIVTLP